VTKNTALLVVRFMVHPI